MGITPMTQTIEATTPAQPSPTAARIVMRLVLRVGLFVGLLFGAAGRIDWWPGWAFFGLYVVAGLGHWLVMRRHDPQLLVRRQRMGEGTKGWDKVLVVPIVLAPALVALVAGLDARFGWSQLPGWLFAPAALVTLLGFAAVTWAMMTNTHFEGTVRIQTDRGHKVVDSGPYRLVRHPGYAAILPLYLTMPLMLGSWWGYAPAVVASLLLVVRTSLEDRTLQRELEGYANYASRVRSRLLPGIW
jgi:protein-S-isoprenylcysteine O-methyltransferase Ste14